VDDSIDPHAKGAKLDHGKAQPELIIRGFANALLAVSEVGTAGAIKYSPDGWAYVDNGQERYRNAGFRHTLKRFTDGEYDRDSGQLHLAHEAWNKLAELELFLREQDK